MSHLGDEMQVNGAEGVDLGSQSLVDAISVVAVQPSSVAEPEDRLVAQSPPPPMPLSMAGPSRVQGGAVVVLSVLHLHWHEHTEAVVDQEARAVVDWLAT